MASQVRRDGGDPHRTTSAAAQVGERLTRPKQHLAQLVLLRQLTVGADRARAG
jgi:hypothetical protein